MPLSEHRAARLSDLGDGDPVDVDLDGTKVLLVRQGDTVHAVAALCPHKGVPLSKGVVEGGRIVCGIHRAAFELATGEVVKPPACESLARYDVRIEGDDVFVAVDDREAHPLPAMGRKGASNEHFVVIGAGAAGWRAAEALRRDGFEGRVTVVTDEAAPPYDRTDLSKGYIKADEQPDDPIIRRPRDIREHDIEVVQAHVTALDPNARTISLRNGQTLAYSKVLIATGCDARRLDVEGSNLPGIHVIRTLTDAKRLRADLARVRDGGAANIVIVGGGFIGLEAASALCGKDGVSVTVVLSGSKPFAELFGDAFAERLKREHEAAGVRFVTNTKVTGFGGEERVSDVQTDGEPIPADLVVVAIGAEPRTHWLPFKRGDDGGVAVDEHFAVRGAKDVYAAGDIARVPTQWGDVRIEHWRFAQETGELAARNMMGTPAPYDGTPFFWSMQQIEGSYTYTGHANGFDAIEGGVQEKDFAAAFVKDGKIQAVLAHGVDDEVTALEPRMHGRGPLPKGEVELA